MNHPSPKDLKVFLAVARRLSFSRAADDLGMSAAFISKRIGILEEALGCRLLSRSARSVALTEQGTSTIARANEILTLYNELRNDLDGPDCEPTGEIRVTSSAVMGRKFIAPALAALANRFTSLQTRLEIVDHRVNLIAEKVDIDVRVGGSHNDAEFVHHLAPGRRILCASPAYLDRCGIPRTLQELTNHQCLLIRERAEPFGRWSLQKEGKPATVQISASSSSNDGEVVRSWSLAGMGIMLRSYWDVAESLSTGQLMHILPEYSQPANVVAVTVLRSSQSPRIRHGIEWLRNSLNSGPFRLSTPPGHSNFIGAE